MSRLGILALQGGFRLHRQMLDRLHLFAHYVRTPSDLDDVDALVIPGGESTTITKLLATSGLDAALRKRTDEETLAVFGTCAGMILCASDVTDGTDGQTGLGLFNAAVRRNGLGSQRQSREVSIEVDSFERSYPAVFIRPPVVETVGCDVEVLARWQDRPILCRQGRHLFSTFHPEMTADGRIHRLFLERL